VTPPPVALADLAFVGTDLARPECVVATAQGDVFVSDRRGGITRLGADGSQTLLRARDAGDFLPNGFALLPDRSFAIANLGPAGGVWRMAADGTLAPEVTEVEGVPLPGTNFVNADHSRGELRLWISVSTRHAPREQAFSRHVADGFIVLKDRRGVRVVADGIGFTNENKTDPGGRFLYVNETMARRLSRFAIRDDASLGPRETVAEFGPGTFPDGFEFDAEGGIWIASVVSNRLLRIAPDGSQSVILEDSDPAVVAAVEEKYKSGATLARADIDAGRAPARQPGERRLRRAGPEDGPPRLAVRAARCYIPLAGRGRQTAALGLLIVWEVAHAGTQERHRDRGRAA
jgi:SMP-30/Gluconolactonase/LRE-like region